MSANDQQQVHDFLQTGAVFSGEKAGGQEVSRIDTHCASIFLSGDRAWKIKRAVRFPYLDFSTPDLRYEALAKELELNKRTAPDLYLGLHAITLEPSGELALDGGGSPVDWVLEMRRFPDGALLSQLADGHVLSLDLLQGLTDEIAAFHTRAEVVSQPDGFERLAAVIEMNIASLEAYADLLGAQDVGLVSKALRAALNAGEQLLRERSAAGRVRHVHGDLHLANIALIDGRATPFDCLEFDADLATIDTLYDLAFLIMDLWQRDLRAEANAVFNRYLDISAKDEGGIALMSLFLACRAVVRSHVGAAQAQNPDASPAVAAGARRYLRLAFEMLHSPPPVLVATGGLSGSGKTSLARQIAPWLGRAPGARIARSDVLRKRLAGISPETRLPGSAYTREASAAVYAEMAHRAEASLDAGQAAIADAVFATSEEREMIAHIGKAHCVPFLGLWLDCAEDQRVQRVDARSGDASDADASVARAQSSYPLPPPGEWVTVNANTSQEDVFTTASVYLRERQMLSENSGNTNDV